MTRKTICFITRCKTLYILLFVCISALLSAQTLTLDVKDKPLGEVLQKITKETGYQFVYSDLLDLKMLVSVKSDKEPLVAVLERLFSGKEIVLKIDDKNIALSPKSVAPSDRKVNNKIVGQVTDESGEVLPGVGVQNQTTGVITATDGLGSYTLEAAPGDKLLFTLIGMKSELVEVGKSTTINMIMSVDVIALQDVVVTGYQTISKERSTGSFVKITTEQMGVKRLNSLETLLEGEIPGLSNGVIRGVTSMNGNTAPLYVIDGFPVENTKYDRNQQMGESAPDINLEDIESITVLKDAAATSIYGARAANGVIVIETKKAKQNQTRVNFSGNLTIKPKGFYTGNIADAATVIGMEREWAETNANLADPSYAQSYAQGMLSNASYPSEGIKTILNYYAGNISQAEMESKLSAFASKGHSYINDLVKYAKRDRFMQQYNVSISKGSDNNALYASLTYKNNKFEDINSKDQSFGLNISNQTHIADWLKLELGSYINYGKGQNQTYSLLMPGYSFNIYDSLVNSDGSYFTKRQEDMYSAYQMGTIANYGLYNMDVTPLDELNYNLEKTNSISTRNYIRLGAEITEWLRYSASFQYEYSRYESAKLGEKESVTARQLVNNFVDYSGVFNLPYQDTYFGYNSTSRNYGFRQQLDFNKSINERHNVIALAGMEIRDNKTLFDNRYLYGYDKDMLSYTPLNMPAMSFFSGVWGWGILASDAQRELINRYVSLYGNAAYSFDDKYVVSGSLRWDRSNLWSTSSQYQNKPAWSVGLSWNADREDFIKETEWISMLKVRSSLGVGGNVSKDAAPYLTMSMYQNTNVGGLQGTVLGRPNPQLSWEMTRTLDMGLDFAFFNNRLSGSFDYYFKRGLNLLANTIGAPIEGQSAYSINNGEMTNTGVELNLTGVVVNTNDWMASVGGTFSYNKNVVTFVDVDPIASYLLSDFASAYPRVGEPYNAQYALKWAGLSATGLPQVYDSEGNITTQKPQDLESIISVGSVVPIYFGSLHLNISYKNVNLSALFTYEGGHKIKNTNLPFPDGSAYSGGEDFCGLLNSRYKDRWMKPGDELTTDIPKMVSPDSPDYNYNIFSLYQYADINMLDGDNLRLRNLSLSYSLPKRVCDIVGMGGVKVQLLGENLFTIAKSPEAKYMLNGYNTAIYSLGLQIYL